MRGAVRDHVSVEVVGLEVLFPHFDQVLRADDERHVPVFVAQHQSDRDGSQGFTEPDDVAEHRSLLGHDSARQSSDRGRLVFEELRADLGWHRVFGEPFAHVAGEVVADLEVHLVRAAGLFPRPRFVQQG